MAHYLHTIGRADSPRCPCHAGIQTVRHMLTECLRTRNLREELLERAHDVEKILRTQHWPKQPQYSCYKGNLLGQFRDIEEAPKDLEQGPWTPKMLWNKRLN